MSARTAEARGRERATAEPILSIDKLSLHVRRDDGVRLKIVEDVSFRILPGQFFALVGESGSGKTMIARAIMRLLPDALLEIDGAIRFGTHELAHADEKTLRPLRGSEIAMIFQEPMSSLNPLMTVERQLTEAMEAHGTHKGRDRRAHIIDLLAPRALPRAAADSARLSARAVRRHAPARHDRDTRSSTSRSS